MQGRDKEDGALTHLDETFVVKYNDEVWIENIGLGFPINRQWLWSYAGDLEALEPEHLDGSDRLGHYEGYEIIYTVKGEAVIALRVKDHESISSIVIEAEALKDLQGTKLSDSFAETTFNAPILSVRDSKFLLYSWGSDEEFPGWPEALCGKHTDQIPQDQAFAPLILLDGEKTLIISPLNHYLVSPLRVIETPQGLGIARGIHGAIDFIPKGMTVKTVCFFGEGFVETLYRWGDLLLKLGGKSRISPSDHPFLQKLGYWNAWGGYYAELFAGMDEAALLKLGEYFQDVGIPLGYFGLDLWYYYDRVGLAKSYEPCLRKYPSGLGVIARKIGRPFFLHLSAFDKDNIYSKYYPMSGDKDDTSCYPTSKQFYRDLATRLKEEGALGIWHDWLRSQQHFVKELRNDISKADEWFSWIAEAFGEKDLAMMLCMQTMGFLLASTQFQNIIAARSYTDYLFKQEGQLECLNERGEKVDPVTPQDYLKNELLVGLLIHALGMYPFNDLFITNSRHPEGFADPDAEQEALMRALSSGPVGIGDKVGEVDVDLVKRLVFPDGTLAKPDHPLYPLRESLGEDILVAYTESRLNDEVRWIYLAIFNIGEEELPYQVDTKRIYGNTHLIYDYFNRQVVSGVRGTLKPAKAGYYILAPEIDGVGFLGFEGKFVTAPAPHIRNLQEDKEGIQVSISAPQGDVCPLRVYSRVGGLTAKADSGARVLKVTGTSGNGLYVVWVKARKEMFSIQLKREVMA